jgi:hypothetical protein
VNQKRDPGFHQREVMAPDAGLDPGFINIHLEDFALGRPIAVDTIPM